MANEATKDTAVEAGVAEAKATEAKATDAKGKSAAAEAKAALDAANARAEAAERFNAELATRLLDLEERFGAAIEAKASATVDSLQSKQDARDAEKRDAATFVKVVVTSGSVHAPTDELDANGKPAKTEDGKVKHRAYEEGETIAQVPIRQARELRDAGYVTIVR